MPLPNSIMDRATALSAFTEDQLCLLTHLDDNPLDLYVWVTTKIESNEVMSCSKFLTAKTNTKLSRWMNFLSDHENNVLVCCEKYGVPNDVFLHIVGEDKYIQVHYSGESKLTFQLTYYVPSLVQIQQGV
ncbi:unnamed protein product [Arabidopsis lyrata]|uniref:F-box associated beta-propeller type 1 domain-containing protein n=1 Tax=Arabidopsis lyrata subsp. lyrata TaxID=81972 RepID=D7L004_ARALL|nr:hypothetical protein ARALYDRAFT_898554 [Arabidopsis lyrata subsp. lyrata]CAH8261274.1 unnamed protein product [Arabidopsis lyrata]